MGVLANGLLPVNSAAVMQTLLSTLNTLLLPNTCGFGYRIANKAIRYHAFISFRLCRSSAEVIDNLMFRKVLEKLCDSHRERQIKLSKQ